MNKSFVNENANQNSFVIDKDKDKENSNHEYKEASIVSSNWSNCLLGNQFLKLYFYKLGISNSLSVDRILKVEEFGMAKLERLQFVIVRSKYNEQNIEYDRKSQQKFFHRKRDYEEYERIFENNGFLFFTRLNNTFEQHQFDYELNDNPKHTYRFQEYPILSTNLEKVLMLAYSGFFNLYNQENRYEESNYFDKKDGNTPISKFFDKMKNFIHHSKNKKEERIRVEHENEKNKIKMWEFIRNDLVGNFHLRYDSNGRIKSIDELNDLDKEDRKNKEYFDHEILSHYAEKMIKIEMNQNHHDTCFDIAKEKISGIISDPLYDGKFSLFFFRDEIVYEYRQYSGEILIIAKNVKHKEFKQILFDHLYQKRNEREIFYEDDITAFSEITESPIEKIETPKTNFCLSIVQFLLFLYIFSFTFSMDSFYRMGQTIAEKSDLMGLTKKMGVKIVNKEGLKNTFMSLIFDTLYNENNKNTLNYLTEDTLAILLAESVDIDNDDVMRQIRNNTAYFLREDFLFSGCLVNFKTIQKVNKTSLEGKNYSVAKTVLNYASDRLELKTGNDGKFKMKQNTMLGESYEIFLPGTFSKKFSKRTNKLEFTKAQLRNQLNEAFKLNIAEFSYLLIFYSRSRQTFYSSFYFYSVDPFNIVHWDVYNDSSYNRLYTKPYALVLAVVHSIISIMAFIYIGWDNLTVFSNSIFESITVRSNLINFERLFDLITSALCIICNIFILFIYIAPDHFSQIVFKHFERDSFYLLYKEMNYLGNIFRFYGVCLMLLNTRIVYNLLQSIPTYGILLQTLKYAFGEIFSYFALVFLMLVGYGILAHSSFGNYKLEFRYIEDSIYYIYLMFVGIFDKTYIQKKNIENTRGLVFVVLFMLIIHLILINLFISIFIVNYSQLKQKFFNYNSIISIKNKEKFDEFMQNIDNLISFKHPQLIEYEDQQKSNQILSRFVEDNLNEKQEKEMRLKEMEKIKLSNVNVLDITKYNIKRMYNFIKTKDEIDVEENKKEYLQKSEQINFRQTFQTFKRNNRSDFNGLFSTIIFSISVYCFILLIQNQTRIEQTSQIRDKLNKNFPQMFDEKYTSFNATKEHLFEFIAFFYKDDLANTTVPPYKDVIRDQIENKAKNLIDLTDKMIENIKNNVDNVVNKTSLNKTREEMIKKEMQKLNNRTCPSKFKDNIINYFWFVNPAKFRLSFRFYSTDINDNKFSKKYFPVKRYDERIFFDIKEDPTYCNNKGSFQDDFKIFSEIIKYQQPGLYNTANNCGGYSVDIFNEGMDCNIISKRRILIDLMDRKNLFSMNLEFYLFNIYDPLVTHVQFSFTKGDFGYVNFKNHYNTIPVNLYITAGDFKRVMLEITALLFSIFYCYYIIKEILIILKKYIDDDFDSDPKKGNFLESNPINKFFRFDEDYFHGKNIAESVIYTLSKLLKKFLNFFIWFIKSIMSYLYADGFNVLDFIYMVFLFDYVRIYYKINHFTRLLNFQQKNTNISPDISSPDNYMILMQLDEQFGSLTFRLSILGSIMILRIFKFLTFSTSINTLMLLIYKSKDLIFFQVVAIISLNIGFSYLGYAFFSSDVKQFRTIDKTFISVLNILGGEILNLDFQNRWIRGMLFIFCISVINYLIFLNIMLAIVVDTYYVLKDDIKKNFGQELIDNVGQKIIKIIYNNIISVFDKIEYYYHDVQYYKLLADENKKQLDKEKKEMKKNWKSKEKKGKSTGREVKKNYYYELLYKNKKTIQEYSREAEKCLIGMERKNDSNNLLMDEGDDSGIGIFEKMFCYIFEVFLEEEPDIRLLFEKEAPVSYISAPNEFLQRRFENDEKGFSKQIIDNKYLDSFVKGFNYRIVKKKNQIFKKSFIKRFKHYIIKRQDKVLKDKRVVEQENMGMFYSKQCFEPLSNFSNRLNFNQLFKIEPLKYNKLLNIIIHVDTKTTKRIRNRSKNLNFADEIRIRSLDVIKHNDDFNDIMPSKNIQLKYLKICVMTYDLIVKYFYKPNNLMNIEETVYESYWLYKFKEIEFNAEELRNLGRHLPKLIDNFFYEDIKNLIDFDLKASGFSSNYNIDLDIDKFIESKYYSVKNNIFDLELNTNLNQSKDEDNNNKNNRKSLRKKSKRKFNTFNNNNNENIHGDARGIEISDIRYLKKYVKNNIGKDLTKGHMVGNNYGENNNGNEVSSDDGYVSGFKKISLKRDFDMEANDLEDIDEDDYEDDSEYNEENSEEEEDDDNSRKSIIRKNSDVENNLNKENKILIIDPILNPFKIKEEALKKFLIWNTIFIIFFKKNYKFVKFLESISMSNYLLNKYNYLKNVSNNICMKSSFLYLFTSLFFLNKPAKDKKNNVYFDESEFEEEEEEEDDDPFKINKNKGNVGQVFTTRRVDNLLHLYNQFITINSVINIEDSEHTDFTENLTNYIINTKDFNYQKNLRDDIFQGLINSYKKTLDFKKFYPSIFKKMWQGFSRNIKFLFFFGFNSKFLKDVDHTINSMDIEDYYSNVIIEFNKTKNDEDKKKFFKVTHFMKAEHRAHLFYILNIEVDNFMECKRQIGQLLEGKVVLKELFNVKNLNCLFEYMNLHSIRIGTAHKIYLIIYDNIFGDLKIKFVDLIKDHEKIFDEMILDHFNFFNDNKNRFKFVKYFKYMLTIRKYKLFYEYFYNKAEEQIRINQENANNENKTISNVNNNENNKNATKGNSIINNARNKETKRSSFDNNANNNENKRNSSYYNTNKNSKKFKSNLSYTEKEKKIQEYMKRYELLIYFLSLDSIEAINTLRKIENKEIREFFTMMLIYFYTGTDEFEALFKYLIKYQRTEIITKYEKFGRDEMTFHTDSEIIRKENIKKMKDKLEYLRNKNSDLKGKREALINKLHERIKVFQQYDDVDDIPEEYKHFN